jgi:Mrp family chromosome partitioning ATPase
VLAVSDPLVLSQYADATVFVVCYNQTTKQSLVRARDLLLRANARISGVVVNRMNMNSPEHYYSYGYYAYQQKGYYNDARN